jgi:hypothetical protein
MILYQDALTGAEILCDAFPINNVGGIIFKADGMYINIEEFADDDKPPRSVTVLNVVHSMGLSRVNKTKEDFEKYLQDYLQTLTSSRATFDSEKVQNFYATEILPRYDNFTLYSGTPEGGMLIAAEEISNTESTAVELYYIIAGLVPLRL